LREFHSHIAYVDESGDHGPISPDYPVFVLAFCLFEKRAYAAEVTTALQRLKFEFFGHDSVTLHETDIRKARPPFDLLQVPGVRQTFMERLNEVIAGAEFTIVAAAIRKDVLGERYAWPMNPYLLALEFGLERICRHLEISAETAPFHCVFESRGRKEDRDLRTAFGAWREENLLGCRLPIEIEFASKRGNYCGLELADLVARPIGLHVLRPLQPNRAFDLLKPKLRRSPSGRVDGWGLKIFF
jgi:hypothetical protein